MKKTVYIHIGMPKTGTSSIQVFLAKNVDGLKANDVCYPELENLRAAKEGRVTSGNMGYISRSLLPTFHADFPESSNSQELLSQLAESVNSSENSKVILSSEFLSVVPEKGLSELYKALSEHKVRIIVYFRAQEKFIQSVYAQRVKRHEETESPDAFVEKRLKKDSILNYYKMLEQLSKVFGKSNIIVRVYEKEQLVNNNLLEDFLDAIGIKRNRLFNTEQKWANKTPGKNTIYLSRFINNKLPAYMSSRIIKHITAINIDRFMGRKNIINHDLQQRIIDSFKDSNKSLAQEYLGRKKGVLFIRHKQKENKG